MDIGLIKGVGSKTATNLKSLGIKNVKDAIYYFPRDYQDRDNKKDIKDITDGEYVTVRGEVSLIDRTRKTYNGKTINKIIFKDSTGYLTGVWFNQPYISKNFKRNEKVFLFGKASKNMSEIQIIDPEYEKVDENNFKGINPLYALNKNITQKALRNIIAKCLDEIDDEVKEFLPEYMRNKYNLIDLKTAISNIHFPQNNYLLNRARERLKFDELLVLQLGLYLTREKYEKTKNAYSIAISNELINFKSDLPFKLTAAQSTAVREILRDMKHNRPMNRLVQGDVGSGKTIVALIALFNCAKEGYQGAMMAPTEILAKQHYEAIESMFTKWNISIALLTGSTPKKEKEETLQKLSRGEIKIIVGTHALIQEKVKFKNLALVITDEQHRFGVRQRSQLIDKGHNPHVLIMTATPIPRTLALFVYGDMDISIINELPPGRQKIDTYSVGLDEKKKVYDFVKKQVNKGRQAYVVCPLVDESEKMNIDSAVEIWDLLRNHYCRELSVGLLHGKMKAKEKNEIMNQFNDGKIDILVSTTVIEVGVNVPNANIMVIENAERFGLAQLHQLRGRVGRGKHKSYCILITNSKTKDCEERMQIMTTTNDGFIIADKDMKLRGTGEFFGFRQHGYMELKIADIQHDIDILRKTQELTQLIIKTNDVDDDDLCNLKNKIMDYFEHKIDEIAFN